MACRSARFPCCLDTKCICPPGPQGPPGPAGDINWGAAAFDYVRDAVVGLINKAGDADLGSGFWVNTNCVMTAWHVVERESEGVRVIVQLASGPPLALDGVVSFAVPSLDVAFVTVNPALYAGTGFTPRVLTISPAFAAGETIFSLTNVLGNDPNSFGVGVIREAQWSVYGYVSDLLTSVPHLNGTSGAAIIRASDFAVVGMNQYGFLQRTADGSFTEADGYSGGTNGRLLQAAVQWAGAAKTSSGVPVLNAAFLPGPSIIPVLRESIALGQVVEVADLPIGSGVNLTVPLPMVTAAVNPDNTPLGAPANGAWVYDALVSQNTEPFGNYDGTWTFGFGGVPPVENPIAYASIVDAVALSSGYARSPATGAFVDISTTGTLLNADAAFNSAAGYVDLSAIAADPISPGSFRISAQPSGAGACTAHVATEVYVSALGFAGFGSAGFPFVPAAEFTPAELAAVANNPGGGDGPSLYATPYGSADFRLPSTGVVDYSVTPGTPGSALAVYHKLIGSRHVIQWTGFAQSTGDPVSFQLWLEIEVGDQTTVTGSGQVFFVYGVLSGAWAGKPWLAATTMTSDPAAPTSTQLIRVDTQPMVEEVIYFGVHSFRYNIVLPLSPGSSVLPILNNFRAVAPRRYPDGTIDDGFYARGTVAVIINAATFQYALTWYDWPGASSPLRVSKVSNADVGDEDLNAPSLPSALLTTAPTATSNAPITVVVSLTNIGQTSASVMVSTDVVALVTNASYLGNLGTSVSTSNFSVQWTPATGAVYSAAVYNVPGNAEVQPNITTIEGTVVLDTADFAAGAIFAVQLAATNSSSLETQFGAATDETCLVVSYDGTTYSYETRSGYGGATILGPLAVAPLGGSVVVPMILGWAFTGDVTQKVNAIVVGRPPRAGNQPANDPLSPSTLGAAEVNFNVVTTAPLASVSGVDPTRTYAVTSTSNVQRPLFLNPFSA